MPSRLLTLMPFDSCVRDRSCSRESTTHVRASRRRSYHNVFGRVTTFQTAAIRKHDDAWASKVSSEICSFHALSLFHRTSSKRVCKHYGSRLHGRPRSEESPIVIRFAPRFDFEFVSSTSTSVTSYQKIQCVLDLYSRPVRVSSLRALREL